MRLHLYAKQCRWHMVGRGCPDLLVGYRGVNYLLEVKDGEKPKSAQKLTPDEDAWHFMWMGQVAVVTCDWDCDVLLGCWSAEEEELP